MINQHTELLWIHFFLIHKNSVTYSTVTCKQMIWLTYDVDSKPKKVAKCEKKYWFSSRAGHLCVSHTHYWTKCYGHIQSFQYLSNINFIFIIISTDNIFSQYSCCGFETIRWTSYTGSYFHFGTNTNSHLRNHSYFFIFHLLRYKMYIINVFVNRK